VLSELIDKDEAAHRAFIALMMQVMSTTFNVLSSSLGSIFMSSLILVSRKVSGIEEEEIMMRETMQMRVAIQKVSVQYDYEDEEDYYDDNERDTKSSSNDKHVGDGENGKNDKDHRKDNVSNKDGNDDNGNDDNNKDQNDKDGRNHDENSNNMSHCQKNDDDPQAHTKAAHLVMLPDIGGVNKHRFFG
jgi:hypothetical protein